MTAKQCPFKVGDELAVCSSGFGGRIVQSVVTVTRILKAYFETGDGSKWDFGHEYSGERSCHRRGDRYSHTYVTPYTDAIKREQAEKDELRVARDLAEQLARALRCEDLTADQIRNVNVFLGDVLGICPESP